MLKDDEIQGVENSYTTFFREFDSRLGRWWSIDPKVASQPNQSPFCSMDNNPIRFNDPMGDEIINGDKVKADETKQDIEKKISERSAFMNSNGISENTTKENYLNKGGNLEKWDEFETYNNEIIGLKNIYAGQVIRANKTQEIIDNWSVASKNIFNEVNSKNIDFVLFSEDLSKNDCECNGYNDIEFDDKSETIKFNSGSFWNYNHPHIIILIDENVNLYTSDLDAGKDEFHPQGQFSLNHEAGHFLYVIQNPKEYYYYHQNIIKNNKDFSGGHRKDDKSGQKANYYGSFKDL